MGSPPSSRSAEATCGLVGDQGAPYGASARINNPGGAWPHWMLVRPRLGTFGNFWVGKSALPRTPVRLQRSAALRRRAGAVTARNARRVVESGDGGCTQESGYGQHKSDTTALPQSERAMSPQC